MLAIIHDNRSAIERGLYGMQLPVRPQLEERWIRYEVTHMEKRISLFAIGSGCGPTNGFIESLSKDDRVIKIGTCSALKSGLKDGNVFVPQFALNDEGSTHWHKVWRDHKYDGIFNDFDNVSKYITGRKLVSAPDFAKQISTAMEESVEDLQRLDNAAVWSVDSYKRFDTSPNLWGQVEGNEFDVPDHLSGQPTRVCVAAVEMECAALFSTATDLGVESAAVLVVSRTRSHLLDRVTTQDDTTIELVEKVANSYDKSCIGRDEGTTRAAEANVFAFAMNKLAKDELAKDL